MASTVKGGTFGKEKKGTSPSNSFKKSSPSSSSTNDTTSSATSPKPVPNYLKPTISSNRDFSRLPKKSTSLDPSADKPALNRRMSFDRGNTNVPGALGIKPLRSSSFSHKPASERPYARATSSLSPRDNKVEPAFSKSRTLKKSALSNTTTTAKKGTNPSKSVTHMDHPCTDQLTIEEEFLGIQCEVQSLPEISEMPDGNEELGDPTVAYIDQQHLESIKGNEDDSRSMNLNLDHSAKQGTSLKSATPYQKPEILKDHQDKGKSINYDHVGEQGPSGETIKADQKPETVKDSKPMNSDQVAKQGLSLDQKPETVKDSKPMNSEQVVKQGISLNPKPETVKDSKPMNSDQVVKQGLSLDHKAETVKDSKPMNSDRVVKQGLSLDPGTVKGDEGDGSKPLNYDEVAEAPDHKHKTVNETVVDHSEKAVNATSVAENEAESVERKTEEIVVEKEEKAKDEIRSTSSPSPRKAPQNTNNPGKKEKQEYNDVIEKTASELMGAGNSGRRKNKVLALAGAFETVISLENTKK